MSSLGLARRGTEKIKLRKVAQGWSVVEEPNPLTDDGRPWRDISLGDTLEEILRPKTAPTRRERMNLPEEVPMPPSYPCSSPTLPPPRSRGGMRPATRKSKRNFIS